MHTPDKTLANRHSDHTATTATSDGVLVTFSLHTKDFLFVLFPFNDKRKRWKSWFNLLHMMT